MTNTNWRRAIIAHYPQLFQAERDVTSMSPGYPDCADGWREVVETAARRIAAAARGHDVHIDQITEKYGTLHIRWSGTTLPIEVRNAIADAVALAEARSACTCETCGKPGRLYTSGSWDTTWCRLHSRGEPVPVRPGFENIRIVRRVADGRTPVVICQRYDRNCDSFTDVDPRTLGIGDDE